MCTPANTPATPPNFPDALTTFSRLKASESFHSSSPVASLAWAAAPPSIQQQQSMWTSPPPSQPSGWPATVSQQATSEQKANVTMEAER
ncbi:hypothetical protein UY3_13426 [Chelonia mydas]|uniref:Uncharacterized protein n=1 Tax=Chelonia mydas TaxID=8469 RepID=M7B1Y7_CHEMY|nr:hypothetical protein UY3_13426 [Chelonia mydas]